MADPSEPFPPYPALYVAPAPGAPTVFVPDASIPTVTDDEARAAYRAAVEAVERDARIATRRAADLTTDGVPVAATARGVALSAVERGAADALAGLRTVALASDVEALFTARKAGA